jgi:hypothetical protein
VTAPIPADPDVHPREDAVAIVRAALLALGPIAVDPRDPEDMDAYAVQAVSALIGAGKLALRDPAGQTAERDRYRAVLERIAVDGGGLDEFLPAATLQQIAREALRGDS